LPAVRAGAASADITPGVGVALGGYGNRHGGSTGLADPLMVRALYLADGETELAIAVCDLLGVGSDLVGLSRQLVADDLGIPPDHVLVGATHTHAGPAAFRNADAPEYVAVTARKIAGAVAVARGRAVEAQLKVATIKVPTIGRNRRHPDGPFQEELHVVLADPGRDRPPVATLVNGACHATVLEHDNLQYSADWPGAMARAVERAVGGVAVYLQGAAGDINPVWAAHDFADVERVGGIAAGAVARAVNEMRPLGTGQWCINLSWSEHIEIEAPGRVLEPGLAAGRVEIEIERRRRPPFEAVDADIAAVTAELTSLPESALDQRHRLQARINELSVARVWGLAGGGKPKQRLEVQALRLGDACGLVSLPGEFFVETGRDIAARSGCDPTLIAGYSNGSVGYVPPASAYPEAGYEVGMTQFDPGAAELIADAGVELLRSLG
jgi:hypothetical protein